MDLTLTIGAYGIGATVGYLADRGGPRLRKDWPLYLRAQFLVTAAGSGLFAAWDLKVPREVVGPVLIAATGFVLLGASLLTRRSSSPGRAALESWAAYPNSAFWVLPIAEALVGPAGSMVTALSNAAYTAPSAVSIHLMRRHAPHPQRRATSWIDQSAVLAVVIGLMLHLTGPAPGATHWVLIASGPAFAFVGAALFVGSVLHPHNERDPSQPSGVRRWLGLSVVRIAYLTPLALFTYSKVVAVVAILSALGPPAFNPSQLVILYRYRSNVVYAAARWGWLLVPFGFVGALVAR